MNCNYKSSKAGRKAESGNVRVEPVFRKPIDIKKFASAVLALAIKQAEEKSHLQLKDKSDREDMGQGG